MPSQVRIISPRNSREWDNIIDGVRSRGEWKQEQTYGGIASDERADKVRRSLRTAARHLGIASKIYWKECDAKGKCKFGGDCAYHVYFTIYDLDEARSYKQQQSSRRR